MRFAIHSLCLLVLICADLARADPVRHVLDLQTRVGVSLRISSLMPERPKAAVILLAGGDGGLHIFPNGSTQRLSGNFLLRSQERFVQQGLGVVVVDAPSDRSRPPYLRGFRLTDEHAQDLAVVIRWTAEKSGGKVWLVGTSRGTESAASIGLKLQGMPSLAGIVLTSSILVDREFPPVPALPLSSLRLPVLVVHHEKDSCRVTRFEDLGLLIQKLPINVPHQVVVIRGGATQGDDCHGMAYHGFNGREDDVVREIADWIGRQ